MSEKIKNFVDFAYTNFHRKEVNIKCELVDCTFYIIEYFSKLRCWSMGDTQAVI